LDANPGATETMSSYKRCKIAYHTLYGQMQQDLKSSKSSIEKLEYQAKVISCIRKLLDALGSMTRVLHHHRWTD